MTEKEFSGKNLSAITPGSCNERQNPEPDRIECISVDKVFDSCYRLEEREREFVLPFTDLALGDLILCQLTPGQEITGVELSRVDVGEGFSSVTLMLTVPLTFTNPNEPTQVENTNFSFTKTVTLNCPAQAGVSGSDSTLVTCICVVTAVNDTTVTVACDIQLCMVIKCLMTVELLVPSFGLCAPAPCVTVPGVCPPVQME